MSEENIAEFTDVRDKCGRWNKFSESKLIELEKKILQVLKKAYKGWFVNIGNIVGKEDKIWTISLNSESHNTPLVCLHGFGAAVGFWCLNLDALASKRPVYAIDLLGFGKSSRPVFSTSATDAEKQMVDAIEAWRQKMNIEQFILLGHSFGGYLATSYTISYPGRVKHLILADPWGIGEKPANYKPPLWIKTLTFLLYPFINFNPLAIIRAAGPMGPSIVSKMRGDISNKFVDFLGDKDLISNYIYHCNAQNPTGETAFHSMLKGFGWAKYPMILRTHNLRPDIPITILFGSNTWMDKSIGERISEQRPNSYVKVEIIDKAGHHVQADQPDCFNNLIVEACDRFEINEYEELHEESELIKGDTSMNTKNSNNVKATTDKEVEFSICFNNDIDHQDNGSSKITKVPFKVEVEK